MDKMKCLYKIKVNEIKYWAKALKGIGSVDVKNPFLVVVFVANILLDMFYIIMILNMQKNRGTWNTHIVIKLKI